MYIYSAKEYFNMLKVKKEGVILEPIEREFESMGVLNPTCIKEGNYVHMFYRATRSENRSSIGYVKLKGPLTVVERAKEPVLFPEHNYERWGIEDPRVVHLDGIYYMFYTAFDGKNALVAYAISKDMKKWQKKGIISPKIRYDQAQKIFYHPKMKDKYIFFALYYKQWVSPDVLLWEKDAFIFPEKINGKFALMHRVLPEIQVIYFRDFKELTNAYWKKYLKDLSKHVILEHKYWYESRNIGGGCPPILTNKGWLLIYHGVEDSDDGKVYHAGAALLDRKNPCKVLGHLRDPLFSPEESWESQGVVNNVVFPTGTALFGNRLYIYYGAADIRIAAASVNLKSLLNELTK